MHSSIYGDCSIRQSVAPRSNQALRRLTALVKQFSGPESFSSAQSEFEVSSDGYTYRSLSHKDTSRVLVLLPGTWGQPLTGFLETLRDDSNCIYDALSYFWGTTEFDQVINLGSGSSEPEKELQISPNLFDALQRLRLPTSSRRLWVDAICINQKDEAERSSQVVKMREIFARAQRVAIWLGEEEEYDELAFQALRRLSAHVNNFEKLDPFPKLGWGRDEAGMAWSKGAKASTLSALEEFHLEHLLQRKWFRRSWIVQEVASARIVDVQYGGKSIPWNVFNGLYYQTQDTFGKDDTGNTLVRQACENIATMMNGRRSHGGLMSMDLFDILLTTNANECTDLRDKVFSMLGLAGDWLRKKGIQSDYSKSTSPEDVFKQFAVWDTKQNNKLRILSCASGPSIKKPGPLSSWMPDWTNIENTEPFVRYRDRTGFTASRHVKSRLWHSENDGLLHVDGQFVDIIQRVGQSTTFTKVTSKFPLTEKSVQKLEDTSKWLLKCYAIAAGTSGLMTPGAFDRFSRTMICGLNGGGFPADQTLVLHFQKYFDFMKRAPEIFLEYIDDARHKGITALDHFYPEFQNHRDIELSIQNWSSRRKFCRTKRRRVGFVPKAAQAGDVVCILYGGEVPYILRPIGDGCYSVVGECYIDGIMHGEALSEGRRTKEFKMR